MEGSLKYVKSSFDKNVRRAFYNLLKALFFCDIILSLKHKGATYETNERRAYARDESLG